MGKIIPSLMYGHPEPEQNGSFVIEKYDAFLGNHEVR